MSQPDSQSKRLAKNTLLLYVRTLLIMVISLFTSRVILNTLGVEDYGIYAVVGGFVSLFSIISGTLVATSQRFITIELGKKEDSNPNRIFCAAMSIHVVLAGIVFLLFETIGLWFLNCRLNIPTDRIVAANWVYQFSILSFIINIISAPYTAVIVAHEKMKAFAYISLFDVALKLLLVYALYITPADKLVMYAFFMMVVSLIDRGIYNYYCRSHFEETKFTFHKDTGLYREMFGFAGMNFLGAFASILANQGMDILLNLFFGVTINAARGIANQVLSAVTRFVGDFMTALDPQITKEYASGNRQASQALCFRGSRFAFYLMLVFSVPIIFKTPYILQIWLKTYPEYAVTFVRCAFILSYFSVLSKPLITEILATGNLKRTVLWIGSSILMALPLAYMFFFYGLGPEFAYITLIVIEIISLTIRLLILEKITGISFLGKFINDVVCRISIVAVVVFLLNYIMSDCFSDSLIHLVLFAIISAISSLFIIFIFGIKKTERQLVTKYIKTKVNNEK